MTLCSLSRKATDPGGQFFQDVSRAGKCDLSSRAVSLQTKPRHLEASGSLCWRQTKFPLHASTRWLRCGGSRKSQLPPGDIPALPHPSPACCKPGTRVQGTELENSQDLVLDLQNPTLCLMSPFTLDAYRLDGFLRVYPCLSKVRRRSSGFSEPRTLLFGGCHNLIM